MLYIFQIGAGGTGSWFARTLMHNMAELKGRLGSGITWKIWDPDNVEPRNLIRQPFYNGVNKNKAQYICGMAHDFFTYHKVACTISYSDSLFDDSDFASLDEKVKSKHPCFLVSCVDNTFTRNRIQTHLSRNHKTKESKLTYIDMGVAPDGDWSIDCISSALFMPLKYDRITYPDELLSCAEREEIGPVPQTTFSNIAAGSNAAQALSECFTLEPDARSEFHKSLYGTANGEVKRLSLEDYFRQRMEDI
jgi:hypothetical protein